MNELHEHQEHRIELELIEIVPGRFKWLFFIDGDHLTTSSDELQALANAREDALLIARLEVERLKLRPARTWTH